MLVRVLPLVLMEPLDQVVFPLKVTLPAPTERVAPSSRNVPAMVEASAPSARVSPETSMVVPAEAVMLAAEAPAVILTFGAA